RFRPKASRVTHCKIATYSIQLLPAKRTPTCILSGFAGFCRYLGEFVGGWTKITGFLGLPQPARRASDADVTRAGSREWTQLWSVSIVALVVLFFGFIFYLRYAGVSGNPQAYLYLEVGGTLISFCYTANALVRFRGTHDRTALILAFGFALSGIIETIGYFTLNSLMKAESSAAAGVGLGLRGSHTRTAAQPLAVVDGRRCPR